MKTNYLQAMGITSWRLRVPLVQRHTQIFCCHLLSEQTACIGVLIAEANSSQEQELLSAIRRALKIKTIEGERIPAPRLLLFGAHLADRYHAQMTTVTHSLAEMLDNPRLKAKVWQDLKNFIRGCGTST